MEFTSNVAIGQLVCLFSMMEDDEADNHSHSSHTEVQNSATKIYKLCAPCNKSETFCCDF